MQPIFMASVFKSGTWLVRRIVTELTGLSWNEPQIEAGEMDHGDPALIDFKPGHFFSWHNEPTPAVRARLRVENAKVILVTRNAYDLALSMYRHFAHDIDSEIGRGAGQQGLFAELTRDQGLALTICGAAGPAFTWSGMGPHLRQMQAMLELSAEHPSCVLSFERLAQDRGAEIRRLAQYLGVAVDAERVAAIARASSFEAMQSDARQVGQLSHFQEGKPGRHAEALSRHHAYMIRHLLRTFAPHLSRMARQSDMPEIVRCLIE